MSKQFIMPEITICSFNAEDIITDSAAISATAVNTVKQEMNVQGITDIKIKDWNEME